MKTHFLRNVIETIRSNQASQTHHSQSNSPSGKATEYGNQLKASHFTLAQVARHGFPEHPTALAYDPVQKIAAIGSKSGSMRVFGRPGVDLWAQHKPEFAVTHIKFIVNQGAIITVTADESIHLWTLRGPNLKLHFSSSNTSGSSPGPSSLASLGNSPTSATSRDIQTSSHVGDPNFLIDQHTTNPSPASLTDLPKQPEILHTLKFQREHITCLHQTLASKWLYIGTERGNVHVANVETFELSGYSIAWNKAIELSRKTHPGSIIHLSECPQGTNKLLIGYESGCIVLWDLKSKNADGRYYYTENLLWLAWHYEGKQFIAAHGDGSLVTWQTRSNARPANILHPHAKTSQSSGGIDISGQDSVQSLTSSFARALNNELYRPINKVDWKTTKNGDQFLLFSGGLPYDAMIQSTHDQTNNESATGHLTTPTTHANNQQQSLKTPAQLPSQHSALNTGAQSPISPPKSPMLERSSASSRQSNIQTLVSHKDRESLRSTSLTVMHGRSITVLEMDETIIDFITICDNSPHENDTSDPYAVIVLLVNDLIIIDLTSPGYPSFDSPYPSSQLNESPVTCIQYLADCNNDLIPSLYSSSQNVVTRAPKKGFSDKEWPINGGEWGQSMQSYPELVITGHADGSLKFWDMSGVNFDLISKVKTSKLFERPDMLSDSIIIRHDSIPTSRPSSLSPMRPTGSPANELSQQPDKFDLTSQQIDENFFAIEKIEYYPATKNLVVAGAMSQVIQFRLNKKDCTVSGDLISLQVVPVILNQQNSNVARQPTQYHNLLKPKTNQASASNQPRTSATNRCSGFQAELICVTSLSVNPIRDSLTTDTTNKISYCCYAPPKVTALALHASHNILAYAHKLGIVLVDITQKCLIMNAPLSDLYAATSSGVNVMPTDRDISVQPYATNSILQQHYQSHGPRSNYGSSVAPPQSTEPNGGSSSGALLRKPHNDASSENSQTAIFSKTPSSQNSPQTAESNQCANIHSSASSSSASPASDQPKAPQSRFAANSAFQRQLSSQALQMATNKHKVEQQKSATAALPTNTTGTAPSAHNPQRLFQRQMTSAQLPINAGESKFRRQQNSPLNARNASPSSGATDLQPPQPPEKEPKQKRIISRMLSISTIHSTLTESVAASFLKDSQPSDSQPAQHHTDGGASSAAINAANPNNSAATTTTANDQVPDKFDSAFSRSRSSSNASLLLPEQAPPIGTESIQCLCFLDPTAAMGPSGGQQQSSSSTTSASSQCQQQQQQQQQQQHDQHCQSSSLSATMATDKSLGYNDLAAGSEQLALWVGTSQGFVLLVNLTMPDNEDNRILQLQSVNAEPIPQAAIKLPGAILHLSCFVLEPSKSTQTSAQVTSGPQPSTGSLESDAQSCGSVSASNASSGAALRQTDSLGGQANEPRAAQFMAIVSEKQAKVYQVPSPFRNPSEQQQQQPQQQPQHHHSHHHHSSGSKQDSSDSNLAPMAKFLTNTSNCLAKCMLSDSSYARHSAQVQWRAPLDGESCLVSYLATGNVVVHSLPHLRLLLDTDLVPDNNARIADTMRFSRNGHCLFQPSPSEIFKFTISSQYKAFVNQMMGCLYVAREMPETPRANFFKSLFSATSSAANRQSERDELFGESGAGKASRNVAKHISSLDKLKANAQSGIGQDLRLAREGLDERGEKLSEIEDRTLSMMNQAESYSQSAHQLAQKFKDKKWYQF